MCNCMEEKHPGHPHGSSMCKVTCGLDHSARSREWRAEESDVVTIVDEVNSPRYDVHFAVDNITMYEAKKILERIAELRRSWGEIGFHTYSRED